MAISSPIFIKRNCLEHRRKHALRASAARGPRAGNRAACAVKQAGTSIGANQWWMSIEESEKLS